MMNRSVASALIALLLSTPVLAAVANDSQEFAELCKYDGFCIRLKNYDGSYVEPKAGIIEALKTMNQPLKEVSATLGVDPVAVAGSILGENSMNVTVDDDTHSFLEKIKQKPAANSVSQFFRGKSFSIGFGQIKPEAAMEAESILAKAENRPERSLVEVHDAVLNPIESVKYAAAIVRLCQDAYKKNGFDISKDPGVLATLYNLGKCEEKAADAKKNNRLPRVNFVGFFVNHYKDDIIAKVGLNSNNPTPASTPLATSPPASMAKRLRGNVNLSTYPPHCETEGAGQSGEYRRVITREISNQQVTATGEYKILSPGVDCYLKDYSLIQTSSGKIGWIATDDLNKKSDDFVRTTSPADKACGESLNRKCSDEISTALKDQTLSKDGAGLLEIKLVPGRDTPDRADVKKFIPEVCMSGGYDPRGPSASPDVPSVVIDQATAAELSTKWQAKKDEIVKTLGYKDWDDGRNFMRNATNGIDSGLKYQCSKRCKGPVDKLNQDLAINPKDYKGLAGFKDFNRRFSSSIYFSEVTDADNVVAKTGKEIWQDVLSSGQQNCHLDENRYPQIAREWKGLESILKDELPSDKARPIPGRYDASVKVGELCKAISKYDSVKAKSLDAPVELAAGECADCQVMVMTDMGNGSSSGQTVDVKLLLNLSPTGPEIDDLFSDAIRRAAQQFDPSRSSEMKCTYDPKASADRVAALLKNPCVEAVFVPDYYIIKRFPDQSDKVFYKAFVDDDRFSVKLKDSCAPEGSATKPVSPKSGVVR